MTIAISAGTRSRGAAACLSAAGVAMPRANDDDEDEEDDDDDDEDDEDNTAPDVEAVVPEKSPPTSLG